MAKSDQFRLIDLKLPTLDDQDIKIQVQQTHRKKDSLVLRQPLLVSICHILKPATSFVDSTLLHNNESENGVELETSIFSELNSTLSKLDALASNGCFNTRTLLERQNLNIRIKYMDTILVKFSTIPDLKTLAEHAYFMFPALLMDKTADNAVQRFDEIDLHVASMDLLKFLRCLSWDAKAITTMGCFIFKFLEFLGFLLHGPNQPITELSSSMASLKKNPVSLVGSPLEKLLTPLDQLNNLTKLTLEVIEYISELTLLADTEYSNEDLLLTSAYWAILSVVACYVQITLLMQNGELALELYNLILNLSNILKNLKSHYTICKPQIEEMEVHLQHITHFGDAFSIEKRLSDPPVEMWELMKSFMYSKDGCHSLLDGSTKSKVDLEVLKEKAVIFFISHLDVDIDMINHLQKVYKKIKENDYYKIVWVPLVLKWNKELRQKFENLKSKMPCYIVCYDSPVAGAWFFKGRLYYHQSYYSFVLIDPRHGNKYSDPDRIRLHLQVGEEDHSPFQQIWIGGSRLCSAPPSLGALYAHLKKPCQKAVNQKEPSSGFAGLLARNKTAK